MKNKSLYAVADHYEEKREYKSTPMPSAYIPELELGDEDVMEQGTSEHPLELAKEMYGDEPELTAEVISDFIGLLDSDKVKLLSPEEINSFAKWLSTAGAPPSALGHLFKMYSK